MDYAIDTSTSAIVVSGPSMNTQVVAAVGAHTVNVNALGSGGAKCSASVAITVTEPVQTPTGNIPENAITVSSIQALNTWVGGFDPGTSGSANGSMAINSSPSLSGSARQFNTTFSDYGGERYHVTFGDDINATNFFYDAWVYFDSTASTIANLEMDMNQVMANGQTVIFGFQCDGYSGTWDYTANTGTPTTPIAHWIQSSAACNPRNWTRNTWHHVQISYSRDDIGNVSYRSVWLDGVEQQINATVPSAFALGWASTLLTNFQIDGLVTGSNTVYLDNITISRW